MIALPPRRRSERGQLLEQMQAMTSALEPAPVVDDPEPVAGRVTYVLNPRLEMSSGKTLAQVAHAAVHGGGHGGSGGLGRGRLPGAGGGRRRASGSARCAQATATTWRRGWSTAG